MTKTKTKWCKRCLLPQPCDPAIHNATERLHMAWRERLLVVTGERPDPAPPPPTSKQRKARDGVEAARRLGLVPEKPYRGNAPETGPNTLTY